jgi:hypothetical protein
MKGVCVLALLAMTAGAAGQVLTGHSPGPLSPAPPPGNNETGAHLEAALPALDRAYRAAAADGRWAELIALADVVRRLGHVARDEEKFDAIALDIYRSALTHARRQASLDGVLRIADGFGELGDRDGLKECVRIAERLAAGDREGEADVRALTTRFADELEGD